MSLVSEVSGFVFAFWEYESGEAMSQVLVLWVARLRIGNDVAPLSHRARAIITRDKMTRLWGEIRLLVRNYQSVAVAQSNWPGGTSDKQYRTCVH
jgi:hypothetical protein